MSTTRRGIVTVSIENPEKLIVSFPYNLGLIEKVKSVQGYRWDKENKHWSFPNTNGTLGKILKAFKGEEIHIDPILQKRTSALNVIAMSETPHMSLRGTKSRGNLISSGQASQSLHSFEDLRRELGHANSKTTEIYTHVSTRSLGNIRSPLDNLNFEGGDGDEVGP